MTITIYFERGMERLKLVRVCAQDIDFVIYGKVAEDVNENVKCEKGIIFT